MLQLLLYEKDFETFTEAQTALRAAIKLNKKKYKIPITYVGGPAHVLLRIAH